MRIYQHLNELPKNFHIRIHHAIHLVAIVDITIPFLMQTIFIQGLHLNIHMYVKTQGT